MIDCALQRKRLLFGEAASFILPFRQYRTNELVRRRKHFSSDAMADFEGLLEVNRKICKQQMAEKASPTLPTNCAVLPIPSRERNTEKCPDDPSRLGKSFIPAYARNSSSCAAAMFSGQSRKLFSSSVRAAAVFPAQRCTMARQ